MQQKIKESLRNARSKISITFNTTSRDDHHILAVSTHYINSYGLLLTVPLATRSITSYAGDVQAPALLSIFQRYGIIDRLGFFSADGATCNDLCLGILGTELGFIASEVRIYYNSHMLNNVAKAALLGKGIIRLRAQISRSQREY